MLVIICGSEIFYANLVPYIRQSKPDYVRRQPVRDLGLGSEGVFLYERGFGLGVQGSGFRVESEGPNRLDDPRHSQYGSVV